MHPNRYTISEIAARFNLAPSSVRQRMQGSEPKRYRAWARDAQGLLIIRCSKGGHYRPVCDFPLLDQREKRRSYCVDCANIVQRIRARWRKLQIQ